MPISTIWSWATQQQAFWMPTSAPVSEHGVTRPCGVAMPSDLPTLLSRGPFPSGPPASALPTFPLPPPVTTRDLCLSLQGFPALLHPHIAPVTNSLRYFPCPAAFSLHPPRAPVLGAGPDGFVLSPGHSPCWKGNPTLLRSDQAREPHTRMVNITNSGFLSLLTLDVRDPISLSCGVFVLFTGDV